STARRATPPPPAPPPWCRRTSWRTAGPPARSWPPALLPDPRPGPRRPRRPDHADLSRPKDSSSALLSRIVAYFEQGSSPARLHGTWGTTTTRMFADRYQEAAP